MYVSRNIFMVELRLFAISAWNSWLGVANREALILDLSNNNVLMFRIYHLEFELVYLGVYTARRQLSYYYKNKNKLQLGDRIFCRNSSLQAVCDTSIARITGCVSTLRV